MPNGYEDFAIKFVNDSTGFILNSNHDLLKTIDQGKTWQVVNNIPNPTVNNYPLESFIDIKDSTGVIAGTTGTLYLSSDNGNSWLSVNTGISSDIKQVSVVSRDTIFVADNNGNLYETYDRANTWRPITSSLFNSYLIQAFTFTDSKVGYVGSGNAVYKTTDGGNAWQVVKLANYFPPHIIQIQFLDKDTGFLLREDSVLHTGDGGKTWTGSNSPNVNFLENTQLFFVNAEVGYVGGDQGIMSKSVDSGNTWNSINLSNQFGGLAGMYFISPDTGFALTGFGRIQKTSDSGNTWKKYSFTYDDIVSMSFGNTAIGYASTPKNVYKTFDKGIHWQLLNVSPGPDSLNVFEKIHFLNADTGFVTSGFPVMLHRTFDGGRTWDTLSATQAGNFNYVSDIQFLNKLTGYMALDQKQYAGGIMISKTIDGGITWHDAWVDNGAYSWIYSMSFLNETKGFIVNGAFLYMTTDSLQTFTLVTSSPQAGAPFVSVTFVNNQKGFLTSVQGPTGSSLYETNDGGQTWDLQPVINPNPATINWIKFLDEKVGYIENDNIYKTEDGGSTWKQQNTGPNEVHSVILVDDSTAITYGEYGSILSTNIATTNVGSLQILSNAGCSVSVAANLSTYGEIDSVSFLLKNGDDGTIKTASGSPDHIAQGSITSIAQFTGLTAMNYSVRVRYYNNGTYYYSDSLDFIANTYPKPTIYLDSLNILHSSTSTGNQWYLNGEPINGATNQEYAPAQSGTYSAMIKQNGCNSNMSDTFYFTKDVQSSFSLLSNGGCSISAEDSLSTTGRIDYVSFQLNNLDDRSFVSSIGTPYVVAQGSINSMVQFPTIQGKTYTISALYTYNRVSHYSDTIRFTAAGYQTPSVYVDSTHILHSSSGFGYQWYFNGQAISGANSQLFIPTESGNYSVMISQNGCNSALSNSVYFLKTELGVTLNPNPSHDFFYLYNTQNRALFYEIVNVNGKVVASGILSSTDTKISTTNLNTGQYFIRIADKNTAEKITIPFIKL